MSDEPDDTEASQGSAPEPNRSNHDAADPSAVKRQRTRKRLDEKAAERFWQSVLATPEGRREMWRLISGECKAFEHTFACGPNGFPQSDATWFALGRKSIGEQLWKTLLRFDRANFLTMLDEHDPIFARSIPPQKYDDESGDE